jgi:L-threonylcarbamoyladenylate synthase
MLDKDLIKAIEFLSKGEIVIYPTDTQYAMGADIFRDESIIKVFEIKNRPNNIPIPVAVSCYEDILDIAYKNKNLENIVNKFLPGKLTIILNKKDNVSNKLTSGLNKIAIRIPDNPIALKLLKNFGPLTVTSANIHGKKTESSINKIQNQFKNYINCYLDDGILNNNPSSIIDLTYDKPKLIRNGEIQLKEILAVI